MEIESLFSVYCLYSFVCYHLMLVVIVEFCFDLACYAHTLFPFMQSGTDERSVPGNTIAVQADMPFSGLTTFGTAFLSKFECSQMPHPVS